MNREAATVDASVTLLCTTLGLSRVVYYAAASRQRNLLERPESENAVAEFDGGARPADLHLITSLQAS